MLTRANVELAATVDELKSSQDALKSAFEQQVALAEQQEMALQAQLEALITFLSTTSTSTTTTTTTIPTTTTTTVTTITTTTTVTTVTTTTVGEHTVKTAFFAGLCNEGAGGASRLIGENIKGNTKKWSYSAWYKRTDTTYNAGSSSVHSGEWETLFGAGQQSGSKPHEHLFLYNEMNDFGSSQRYYSHNDGNANEGDVAWKFADSGNYEFGVTYKTRDIIGPQATQTNTRWHHVLFVADTEQSDASKRMTMYIDGTKVELSDSAPMGRGGSSADWRNNWFPDKGMTTGVLSGNPLLIGDFDRFSADGGKNWCFSYHGHIADVYLVDGHALTPEDFGVLNDGVFLPYPKPDIELKDGSFHLDFAGNSMGVDAGPNGHGFSVYDVEQGDDVTLFSGAQ